MFSSRPTALKTLLLATVAGVAFSAAAHAYDPRRTPDQPSIEMNLEVIDELRAAYQAEQRARAGVREPVKQIRSRKAKPVKTATRRAPVEQAPADIEPMPVPPPAEPVMPPPAKPVTPPPAKPVAPPLEKPAALPPALPPAPPPPAPKPPAKAEPAPAKASVKEEPPAPLSAPPATITYAPAEPKPMAPPPPPMPVAPPPLPGEPASLPPLPLPPPMPAEPPAPPPAPNVLKVTPPSPALTEPQTAPLEPQPPLPKADTKPQKKETKKEQTKKEVAKKEPVKEQAKPETLPPPPALPEAPSLPELPALSPLPPPAASLPPAAPELPPAPAMTIAPPPELPSLPPPPAPKKAEVKTETKKDEGWFPGLKKQFSGILGKDEKAEPKRPELKIEKPSVAPAELPPPLELPPSLPSAPPPAKVEAPSALPPAPTAAPELPGLPPLPPPPEAPKQTGLPSLTPITGEAKPAPSTDAPLAFLDKPGEVKTGDLPPAALPPVSKATAPAAPKETQMAAVTPPAAPPPPAAAAPKPSAAPAPSEAPALRIVFNETETEVPLSVQAQLDAIAQQLGANKAARARVVAYAAGSDEQASTARRVSLSRALAVRAYLIEKGVDGLRINVQAMGNKSGGGDPDRTDIFVVGDGA